MTSLQTLKNSFIFLEAFHLFRIYRNQKWPRFFVLFHFSKNHTTRCHIFRTLFSVKMSWFINCRKILFVNFCIFFILKMFFSLSASCGRTTSWFWLKNICYMKFYVAQCSHVTTVRIRLQQTELHKHNLNIILNQQYLYNSV